MAAASVTDVMKFFGMQAGDFMREWKDLPDEYKTYFKEEVGKLTN